MVILSAEKCSCLKARIVVVKNYSASAIGFPDFLEDNWLTKGCVPLRISQRATFVGFGSS